MPEAVAAPPTLPAAHAVQASSARGQERDEGGFQGMLREALVQPAEGDRTQNIQPAPKPLEPAGGNISAAVIAKAPEGIAESDPVGLSLPFDLPLAIESVPSLVPGPAILDAALQVADNAIAAGQADQALAQIITPPDQILPALDDASIAPGTLPLPSGVMTAQTLLAAPPINGSSATATANQMDKTATLALSGQTADVLSAATPQAAQALQAAQAQQQGAAPLPQAVVAKDELPPPQAVQDTLANALAAGPAQAAAGLVVPKPQAAGGTAKPGPIAPAEAALAPTRPEAASRLAQAFNATETAKELKLAVASETAEVSLQLTSLEAPKAIAAKPSGEARAEALPIATQGFAPGDGMAQRMEAPSPSTNTRELPAPLPARQLAPVVVSLALGSRDEALTIALDPVELGRVEVSIGQGKEAGQVRIVAERPETLALLQRDQRELDRALNQSGLGDMARSLSFSLASDQQRQQYQGSPQRSGQRASMTISGVEADRAMPSLPAPLRNPNALIDIAV